MSAELLKVLQTAPGYCNLLIDSMAQANERFILLRRNRKKPSDNENLESEGLTADLFLLTTFAWSSPRRYSRSPCPRRDYSPAPRRRHYSRSVSPLEKRYSHERSYSGSPVRDRSPSHDGAHRSPSRIPVNE
ncbi:hypothetical protein Tco_0718249 [Tanacetum coccineum]